MEKLKFGTDGWRAIIGKDYTTDNVARVTQASAEYIKQSGSNQSVVIGYDARFGGPMFTIVAASVFLNNGIKVIMGNDIATTPMVSLAALRLQTRLGIVITASHNPPSYNGFKIKDYYGGPAVPAVIEKVEELIPDLVPSYETEFSDIEHYELLEIVDLKKLYKKEVEQKFDLEIIRNAPWNFAYDPMFGAGQDIVRELFPKAISLHSERNPGFLGTPPEPIHKNLLELSNLVKSDDSIMLGLANDGDADRIGLYDENGKFVDAHHIILLLIHYLKEYKQMDGKVVVAFSVSPKVKALCEHYGIDLEITKIGFKYICGHMVEEDVLVGGEESGGIAVKGHIPERDGIWDGLILLEYMAKTGKTLTQLVEEIYQIIGSFSYNRNDLKIREELKQAAIQKAKEGGFTEFAGRKVLKTESVDGYKYYLEGDAIIMLRASGTEPVLRVYGEAPSEAEVQALLDKTVAEILAIPV